MRRATTEGTAGWSPAADHGRWDLLESQFEAESFVQSGLLFLGSPLVIACFVIGFNRWRHESAPAPHPAPAGIGA